MEQTVYADILFLINFSMDFLCFYITSTLLHRPFPRLRALFSAAIGGVYSVAIIFAGFLPFLELVCDIGMWFIMCVFVFWGKNVKFGNFMLSSAVYVGVAVALGGLMTAIMNMMNLLGLSGISDKNEDGMPVWLFALIAVISGAATLGGGKFFRQKQSERTADIEITFLGKSIKLSAICDSGNFVRDPISGKSVVVADVKRLSSALPDPVIRAVKTNDTSVLSELSYESAKKLRLVPTKTATGGGMLFAFIPDRLTVMLPGGDIHEVDALFAPINLAGNAKGFDALIPPELLV